MSIAQSSRDNRRPEPRQAKPPDSPCTCAMARRTARHLTREYDRVLKPAGLKLTQYSVLANLVRNGATSITALAERLAMDRTTMTRNLRPLERAGWIVVRDDRSSEDNGGRGQPRPASVGHDQRVERRARDQAAPLQDVKRRGPAPDRTGDQKGDRWRPRFARRVASRAVRGQAREHAEAEALREIVVAIQEVGELP